MCKYCEGAKPLYKNPDGWDSGVDMLIKHYDGNSLETMLLGTGYFIEAEGFYDGGYCCGVATFKCDFCPACGRDLRG